MRHRAILLTVLPLVGCGRAAQDQNQSARDPPPVSRAVPSTARARTQFQPPLSRPDRQIDLRSSEAAGQVVQSYGALIEQGRWAEANAWWGNASLARTFQKQLSQYAEVHLEIGNPGDPEGAAGSIYVMMPVFFYGDEKDGQPFRRSAEVTLRRVNDVPGSSEAQRRWHIERIDLGD